MRPCFFAACIAALLISAPLFSQEQTPQPLSLDLACSGHDCPLLRGAPQTAGMHSGFVRLKPGESVGAHTTGDHEEALVILQGRGKAEVDGREAIPISARHLIYIPPRTRHNVTNTGAGLLEYVYVVAPAEEKPQ